MKQVAKYTYVAKISIANNLVYVFNFLGRNFFFVFILYIMLMLWQNIYGSEGAVIEGFTLNHMIWYLTITELITLSRSRVFADISKDVKNGNIAYMLNKPYHYILYCCFNSLGEIGIKLLSNTVIAIIIGLVYVGPLQGFKFYYLPFIIICILLGVFIHFFIYMCLALTAFWVEENSAFFWIYQKVVFTLGGMLMPIEMFPDWLERISKYLPFAFVTYHPAKLTVSFSIQKFLSTVSLQLIYMGLFFVLSLLIYKKGVRALNVNGG